MTILAGDIGGTKTHLALFDRREKRKWIKDAKFKSPDYKNLKDIVKQFLSSESIGIDAACFGVAGPVQEGKCHTTNLPWNLDEKEIGKEIQVSKVWLINDLEANAYGIRNLNSDELFALNEPRSRMKGNGALISAGTGLGEAGIFWDGKKEIPFATEGGHCSFCPESELEIEIFRFLKKQYDHVSYERILSGPGLYHLYRFIIDSGFEREKEEVKKAFETKDPPRVITEMGMKGACPACERVLQIFVGIYGSEAGNLALKMLAIGGVYLGGGIAPKILNELKEGDFMKRFISKGRFTSLLLNIPVRVILNENTALFGAAEYARERS